MKRRAAVLVAIAVLLLGVGGREGAAASLIRDTEIENTIRAYASPLFEAAGLPGRDIRIYIINDPALNAFVAGGMNLFINTGLLVKSRSASEVIGVIAHETGHISGGHLARFSNRIDTASNEALVATILGALAAIATGRGDVGAAVATAGQGLAVGSLLAYSRAQESAADQAALDFLERTGQSAAGLANFLRQIEGQEFLTASNQDVYVRTHPITRERVRAVEDHLKRSPHTDKAARSELAEMHRRMVAKLIAFQSHVTKALKAYPASDTSVAARYARAIAYYRVAALDKALPLIDGLIREEPENPYFHELKGQMLFENGRIAEAIPPSAEAVRLAPDEPLLRVGLAHAQMESGNPALNKEAINHLLFATNADPRNAFAWRQLAVAYGRDGQIGLSALAQAEAALIVGNTKDALFHIGRAERQIEKSSAAWVRLQDLKRQAAERKDRDESR